MTRSQTFERDGAPDGARTTAALGVAFDGIPSELRTERRWMIWKTGRRQEDSVPTDGARHASEEF